MTKKMLSPVLGLFLLVGLMMTATATAQDPRRVQIDPWGNKSYNFTSPYGGSSYYQPYYGGYSSSYYRYEYEYSYSSSSYYYSSAPYSSPGTTTVIIGGSRPGLFGRRR